MVAIPVEHFGLVFRSASHYHWLIISMSLLAMHLLWQLVRVSQWPEELPHYAWFFVAFHVSTVLEAAVITRLGTDNGPVYSVDCIWFNTLMALINTLVIVVADRIAHERLVQRGRAWH